MPYRNQGIDNDNKKSYIIVFISFNQTSKERKAAERKLNIDQQDAFCACDTTNDRRRMRLIGKEVMN